MSSGHCTHPTGGPAIRLKHKNIFLTPVFLKLMIESSEETAELCVKLFSGIRVDVSISDIDIAHRVPNEILRTVMAAREDSPIQSSASLQEGWYVTRSWLRGITPLN